MIKMVQTFLGSLVLYSISMCSFGYCVYSDYSVALPNTTQIPEDLTGTLPPQMTSHFSEVIDTGQSVDQTDDFLGCCGIDKGCCG